MNTLWTAAVLDKHMGTMFVKKKEIEPYPDKSPFYVAQIIVARHDK